MSPEPALWKIAGARNTIYLFGSIHMLPRDWAWRTRAVDAAIKSSDAFVFETALTTPQSGRMRLFVREHGTLPPGQRLSRMLSPQGLKDFNAALSMTPLDPQSVDAMRPWLALVVLGDYQVQNGPLRSFVEEGVDYTIEQEALSRRKPIRHLETAELQLQILLEATPDGDIEGFESNLRDLLRADDTYRRLVEAWTQGRLTEMASVLSAETAKHPGAKQVLLDKRNRNWLPQIERMMLSGETIFVTVGAAHLAGSGSVLDMLCVRGWNVQRIRTGPTPPPAACPAQAKPEPQASLDIRRAALRQSIKDM